MAASDALRKPRGRPPATGRFSTRQQLVDKVLFLGQVQRLSDSAIARNCRVSAVTVWRILREGR